MYLAYGLRRMIIYYDLSLIQRHSYAHTNTHSARTHTHTQRTRHKTHQEDLQGLALLPAEIRNFVTNGCKGGAVCIDLLQERSLVCHAVCWQPAAAAA